MYISVYLQPCNIIKIQDTMLFLSLSLSLSLSIYIYIYIYIAVLLNFSAKNPEKYISQFQQKY